MQKPWLKFYDPHVPPHIEIPEVLAQHWLDQAADEFPDHVAVFFFGGKVKYGALRVMSNQFAHAVKEIGLKPGDGLGVLLPNMPQAVISAFGAMKAGLTVFFFDPLADEDDLRRQLNDAGVETLVVLDLLLRRIDPIFPRTKVKNFIIAGVKDFLPFPRNLFFSLAARGRGIHVRLAQKPHIHLFREFLRKGAPESPGTETAARSQDPAVVLYTRGTAGRSKGVILTHGNLAANVLQASTWVGGFSRGRETFFSMIPFHEAYGITMALNLPLYWAAGSVHLPRFEPIQFLKAVKARQPTVFPAAPSMIESLAWNPDLTKYKISSIRTYFSVGQALPEDVLLNFEKKTGGKVVEGYGVTEASPLTHANPVSGKRKPGSIGIPLPNTDAKIVNPEDGQTELPPGKTGELIVQGPQVMKGYWNQPEETERTLRGGWLHTGDLAWMDEEGFFFFVSKMKK